MNLRLAAVAGAAALVLGACGSGDADSRASAVDGQAPRAGGTLTFAVSSDAGCVDPQQVGSNDSIYSARQVVDSLTDQDPRSGKIVPWLARSWKISPDNTTFTFTLRKGVTFSDGTPVDAAAVKANFDRAPELGPRATLAIGYLSGYQGTRVVDPLTAEVRFEHPNAQFLQASSTFSLGLVSPATIAKTPDQRCTQGVIGSGPFILERYTQNQSIRLKKRIGYAWGSSLWKKSGEAYLDGLTFTIVPESGVRVGSLQSGQVDAISSVGPQDETAIESGPTRLQARPNPGVVFNLAVNNSRPLVADKAVRQALSAAINRQELVDTVLTKETEPATSILASTTPLYTDLSDRLTFDPEKAKRTLQAAGWVPGPDGIRTKNGRKLSLQVAWFANLATNKSVLELIQQQLKLVGVDLVLKEYPIAKIAEIQTAGDYDLSWGNVTRADPDIARSLYSTKLANFNRIPAGPLDPVLTQQAASSDPTARAALVKRAQELIVDNAYAIPVVELTTVLGISNAVHDLAFEASSRLQFHDTWKSR